MTDNQWQICPKCKGTGVDYSDIHQSAITTTPTCQICDGYKLIQTTIVKPIQIGFLWLVQWPVGDTIHKEYVTTSYPENIEKLYGKIKDMSYNLITSNLLEL